MVRPSTREKSSTAVWGTEKVEKAFSSWGGVLKKCAWRELAMRKMPSSLIVASIAQLFITQVLSAHPGHGSHQDFLPGLLHPFQGLDHLVVALAVGFLAANGGGAARFKLPLSFVLGIILGAGSGSLGLILPGYESGIMLSLLACAGAVLISKKLNAALFSGMLVVLGACHGMAHALEKAMAIATLSYSAGFVAATLVLLAMGMILFRLQNYLGKKLKIHFSDPCSTDRSTLLFLLLF
jgi:urease accessory protein